MQLKEIKTSLSKNEKAAIFAERAKKLAEDNYSGNQTQKKSLSLVIVRIEQETFAFSQQMVKEVTLLKAITKIPGAPSFIAGVVGYCGRVIAVNDLAELFSLNRNASKGHKKILVISDGLLEMGILIDLVCEVKSFSEEEILSELPTMKEIQLELTIGITSDGASYLSAESMLKHPKLILK